jgi:hypothetical protein
MVNDLLFRGGIDKGQMLGASKSNVFFNDQFGLFVDQCSCSIRIYFFNFNNNASAEFVVAAQEVLSH